MEFVFGIVGLLIGIGGGWLLWERIGTQKLNDDFARRLKHTDEQIALERRRGDDAESELEPLRRQIRGAKDQQKDTQKQLEKLKGRFEKLKGERDEVEATLTKLRERADEADKLEPQLVQARAKLAAAFEDNAAVKEKLGEVDGLERQLASARDRLVEAERAKEDARLRAAEAEKVTERATVELEASMETIATLRSAAESALQLQREIDTAQATISSREQVISQQNAELSRLSEQLVPSTPHTDEPTTKAIEAEEVEVEQSAGSNPDPEAVAAVAEEGYVAAVKESEAAPEPDEQPEDSASEPPAEQVAKPSASAGSSAVERMGELAERTAGGKPPANDNLKKIHGVGPKIEKLLKGLGITSFLQVANFTPEDIETVTEALDAFPGRIERDDWVSSADKLYREKYEED